MANEKPNWQEIERCGIWKVLGVIECNSCDGLIKCWGTDTQLPASDKAKERFGIEKILEANRATNKTVKFADLYEAYLKEGEKRFGSQCDHAGAKDGVCPKCYRKVITTV
jgi:hypothetical protein